MGDINRIKVVFAEKKKINRWFAAELLDVDVKDLLWSIK